MQLRVAVVTESFLPQINGVTNSVIRILETFKQREIEAIVIAPTSETPNHLGFEVVTVPSIPIFQFPVAVPSPAVWKKLDEFKPDVVHVAAPFLLGTAAIAWANRNQVPVVAIYQTDVAGYLERYNLSAARPLMDSITAAIHSPATTNLAPTKEAARYLKSIGVPEVSIWGRGVDKDLFNPANRTTEAVSQIRSRIAPNGEQIIGFVGRLAAEKQVHRMKELLVLADTSFLIVGDGPEREKLERLFAGYPVFFTGALTGIKLANHYAAMDTFVHFGTEETFGQTIQEAQATGLVVVAPDRGGPRNLIEHQVSGLLVDPDEENGYLKAVSSIDQLGMRETLAANALRAVAEKSWSANNAKLLDFYQAAIVRVFSKRAAELELA